MKASLNILAAAGLIGLGITWAAGASGPYLAAELETQGWEEITFDGQTPNRFTACGEGCIAIATDMSVSMIGKTVESDLADAPILQWEWQIENPVTMSDLTVKGEDDRAVALYVTFPFDPETATFAERMLRPIVEMAKGADAPGRVISYVWGGFGESGQVVESPYFGAGGVMIISRTGRAPVGQWVREKIDIVADHTRVFGTEPTAVDHVLLSSDSDDTGTKNRAFVRNIMFAARE